MPTLLTHADLHTRTVDTSGVGSVSATTVAPDTPQAADPSTRGRGRHGAQTLVGGGRILVEDEWDDHVPNVKAAYDPVASTLHRLAMAVMTTAHHDANEVEDSGQRREARAWLAGWSREADDAAALATWCGLADIPVDRCQRWARATYFAPSADEIAAALCPASLAVSLPTPPTMPDTAAAATTPRPVARARRSPTASKALDILCGAIHAHPPRYVAPTH